MHSSRYAFVSIRRCTAWHPLWMHDYITQLRKAQRPAKTGTKIEYYVRINPLANSQINRPERSALVRQKRESSVANSYSRTRLIPTYLFFFDRCTIPHTSSKDVDDYYHDGYRHWLFQ